MGLHKGRWRLQPPAWHSTCVINYWLFITTHVLLSRFLVAASSLIEKANNLIYMCLVERGVPARPCIV